MVDLDSLNPAQREAVLCTEGPLLVLAGAGSGKTRVITYRIAHLVAKGASPSEIIALSFTNKAASEMRERVEELIGPDAKGTRLSTFHSLGLNFLRAEYEAAKLGKNFTILDEGDQVASMRHAISAAKFDPGQYEPKLMLARLSHFKGRLEAPDPRHGGIDAVLTHVAPHYAQRLRAMNAVDFDDLIARPVWIMERNTDLAYRWSSRVRYLMVDEYQDTNIAQLRFLQALGRRHGNVCAVGDDDQSIYGWRGAVAGNILRFDHHFEGAKIIFLTQNYRSTNYILKSANAVIENNQARHAKTLWSGLGDGDKLRYQSSPTGDDEAHFVATDLLSKKRSLRLKWRDFAVLYRTNAQSRAMEEALRGASIPHRIIGGTRFYDRKEVRDLVAYLRVMANPYDEAALRRIINYPNRGIGDRSIERIGLCSQQTNTPFWRLVERPDRVPDLGDRERTRIESFYTWLDGFRRRFGAQDADPGALCRALIEALDFRNSLAKIERDMGKLRMRLDNLEEVANGIDLFRQRKPGSRLEDYLSRIALDSRVEEDEDEEDDLVSLMTLHGAKGLEFTSVYFVGFEEGFVPHLRGGRGAAAARTAEDIAEERRLVYVGITRAKRYLTLTGADRRMRFGRIQGRKPSRFLYEIPEALFEGGRTGQVAALTGDALQSKGMAAFAEMRRLIKGE